jgi:hypothetical protein
MSDHDALDFDTETARRSGQLSANGHWVFGSVYATLALVGFSFGVWAGAAKPKPVEVAEAKKEPEKPAPPPTTKPNTPTPAPAGPAPGVPAPVPPMPPVPAPMEPMPKEKPEPKPKDPPEIKPKPPEPKPKEPEPKANVKPVAFKEVLPILRAHCNTCHGDVGKPKDGVDLRTAASIMKGDKNKDPIVVPGKPESSPLYTSIAEGRMPKDGKPAPSPAQLEVIRNWILSGAMERRRPVRVRRALRTRAGWN